MCVQVPRSLKPQMKGFASTSNYTVARAFDPDHLLKLQNRHVQPWAICSERFEPS